jgi:hypothetical protein
VRRPDLIQAQAAGHHGQPAALVLDLVEFDPHQAGERVLHDVLGRADVPEHPEREVDEVGPMIGVRLADPAAIPVPVHAGSSPAIGLARAVGPGRRCMPLPTRRHSTTECDTGDGRVPDVTFGLPAPSLPVTRRFGRDSQATKDIS